jgi:hypothetical protein
MNELLSALKTDRLSDKIKQALRVVEQTESWSGLLWLIGVMNY